MEVLPKRFNRFELNLHPEKTKLIPFGKPIKSGKPKGTFDFLGFTFYWGKTLKGYWVIKKQTARKRLNRFLRMLWNWCKKNRHEPIEEQHKILCSKLRGFYQYFGVRSNYKALEAAYEYAEKAWRNWLGRRHRDGYISCEKFKRILKKVPLPLPRIVHNIWLLAGSKVMRQSGCRLIGWQLGKKSLNRGTVWGKASRTGLWGGRRVTGAFTRNWIFTPLRSVKTSEFRR